MGIGGILESRALLPNCFHDQSAPFQTHTSRGPPIDQQAIFILNDNDHYYHNLKKASLNAKKWVFIMFRWKPKLLCFISSIFMNHNNEYTQTGEILHALLMVFSIISIYWGNRCWYILWNKTIYTNELCYNAYLSTIFCSSICFLCMLISLLFDRGLIFTKLDYAFIY